MDSADMKNGFPAPRQTMVAKMVAKVASNASASLAVIAVLMVLVVGMYVYYHGFLFLGPYAKRAAKRGAKGPEKSADQDDKDGDSETERLIESINSA